MNDYKGDVRFAEMNKSITEIKNDLNFLKNVIKPTDDLWDNTNMILNWHVSERTLAYWRKKKLIGYVQINNKIYYPIHFRDKFIQDNSIQKEV